MQKPKVLLVDDKQANIYVLQQILEDEDLELLEAHSGHECLLSLLEHDVDLILLDIRMPEINGFECATMIRENKKTRMIPIIFVTAADRNEKIHLEGHQHGAIDVIYKPIVPDILRYKVRLIMEMVRTKEELKQQVQTLTELNEENKRMQDRIQELAMMDYLTGLPNRRKIDADYHRLYLNAYREKQPLTVMIADLDNFKGYNDYYGHLAGDQVLKEVSNSIRNTLQRGMDFAGRFGGEEFIIILHNTDEEGAAKVAQKLLDAVIGLQIEHCPKCMFDYLTISIGVTSFVPQDYDSEVSMINLADKALYKAKANGKNTYEIEQPNN